LLRLLDTAFEAGNETTRTVQQLHNDIDSPGLAKELDYASASRFEIEAYRGALETAEAKAIEALPRYMALLKEERGRLEKSAKELGADDELASGSPSYRNWGAGRGVSRIDRLILAGSAPRMMPAGSWPGRLEAAPSAALTHART